MNTIKKFNSFLYFLIFTLFLLQLLQQIFNIESPYLDKIFNGIPLVFFLFLFFFLSIISLFKRDIMFYGVPYFFYVAFIVMMIVNILLNAREDLQ